MTDTTEKIITADRMADFRRLAEARLKKDGGIKPFNYALVRVLRRTDRPDKGFNTEIMNIRIDHGSIDEKGNLLKTPQGAIVYTPEAQKAMNDEILELSNTYECSVKRYFARPETIPTDLTAEELEAYEGLVISEEDVTDLIQRSEAKLEQSQPKALPGAE